MFVNSIFLNVEVWHNVLKKDIDTLIDLNIPSKAPVEDLYLKTSANSVKLHFGRDENQLLAQYIA